MQMQGPIKPSDITLVPPLPPHTRSRPACLLWPMKKIATFVSRHVFTLKPHYTCPNRCKLNCKTVRLQSVQSVDGCFCSPSDRNLWQQFCHTYIKFDQSENYGTHILYGSKPLSHPGTEEGLRIPVVYARKTAETKNDRLPFHPTNCHTPLCKQKM